MTTERNQDFVWPTDKLLETFPSLTLNSDSFRAILARVISTTQTKHASTYGKSNVMVRVEVTNHTVELTGTDGRVVCKEKIHKEMNIGNRDVPIYEINAVRFRNSIFAFHSSKSLTHSDKTSMWFAPSGIIAGSAKSGTMTAFSNSFIESSQFHRYVDLVRKLKRPENHIKMSRADMRSSLSRLDQQYPFKLVQTDESIVQVSQGNTLEEIPIKGVLGGELIVQTREVKRLVHFLGSDTLLVAINNDPEGFDGFPIFGYQGGAFTCTMMPAQARELPRNT